MDTMNKLERQQSLAAARKAAEWLRGYYLPVIDGALREQINHLLDEFARLDKKEQKQIRAGKRYGKLGADHGKKGGRPRKDKQ